MSKSLSFRLQLSSIMEITTKTAIDEICKIVDSDFAFLRQELSRVMSENTVLKDKMLCLGNERQDEGTRITKEARAGSKTYRSIYVQTEDGKYNLYSIVLFENVYWAVVFMCTTMILMHVLLLIGPQPSIKGIFGKEWCSSLWDRRNESREDEQAIDVDLYTVSPYKVRLKLLTPKWNFLKSNS